MKRSPLIFVTLLVQLAVGEDLYWRRSSDWADSENWSRGREPCGAEVASFSSLPSDAVVFVNTDVKIKGLKLPSNGRLVLGNDITIQFSEVFSCTVDGDTQPMAADVQENEFIGAVPDYWECAGNWITEDNIPAQHPPCGSDNAFFDKGSAFSFVRSNQSVTVRSITVRGVTLQSLSDLGSTSEFQFEATITPECAESPSLCPCPPDQGCPVDVAVSRGVSGGVVAGVVVVVILILVAAAIVLAILGFILYLRRRSVPYSKEGLAEEEEEEEEGRGGGGGGGGGQAQTGSKELPSYDNPVYDSAPLSDTELQMVGFEVKPPLGDDDGEGGDGGVGGGTLDIADGDDNGHSPKLNKYERF